MFPYYLISFANHCLVAALTPYIQVFLRNKDYSFTLVGIIVALGQICSIIFPLLIVSFSDKTGKTKWMLMLVAVLATVFFVPVLLSESLALTIVCYCLACATYNSINPMIDGMLNAQSVGHPSRYSYMRAIGTLAYVIVLLVFAAVKWPDSTDNRSILVGIIGAGTFLALSVFTIPAQEKPEKVQREGKLFDFKWFDKTFYIFLLIVGLTRITHSVIDKLLSSYMTEVMHIGGSFTKYYAISAGSEFLVMIYGGKLLEKKKITPYQMITLSCIVLVFRMFILYTFKTPIGLACAQVCHAFTFGALHIGAAAFVASHVDKAHYGMAMTLYWAIGTNLPMMFGALVGGYVIDIFGYPTLFVSYSVFAAVAFVLCLVYRKTLNDEV